MAGAGGLCILAKLDVRACTVLGLIMEIINCPLKMLKGQINVQRGGTFLYQCAFDRRDINNHSVVNGSECEGFVNFLCNYITVIKSSHSRFPRVPCQLILRLVSGL